MAFKYCVIKRKQKLHLKPKEISTEQQFNLTLSEVEHTPCRRLFICFSIVYLTLSPLTLQNNIKPNTVLLI